MFITKLVGDRMSMNDTLSAVLSKINTYEEKSKDKVLVQSSKLIKAVLSKLQSLGYIAGFEEIRDSKGNLVKVKLAGTINKIGSIKPRFALKKEEFEKFEKRYLPAKGFGVLIVSTNKGLLTHDQAKKQGVGGRLIAYCY